MGETENTAVEAEDAVAATAQIDPEPTPEPDADAPADDTEEGDATDDAE